MTKTMLKTVAKGLWTAAMIISFTFAPSAHAQVQMSSNATLAEVLKGLFDKNGNFLQNNDQPEFIVNDDVIQRTAMTIAYFDRFPNDPKQRVAKDWAFQFIYSAHQYGLDWTIGPAFAQIESTGFANDCAELPQHQLTPEFMQSAAGQNYTDLYVNGFGWNAPHYDPCQARFRDYGQAIYHVLWNVSGKRPETAHFYAGKNKYDMLTTYNSVNK